MADPPFQTMRLPRAVTHIAPDGSQIRELPRGANGSLAHCRLPPGGVSKAVAHRTIEELWYVLRGRGQVWRKQDGREETVSVSPGMSVTIPRGTHFQFRATGRTALEVLIATLPPWPGDQEAFPVPGRWPPAVRRGQASKAAPKPAARRRARR